MPEGEIGLVMPDPRLGLEITRVNRDTNTRFAVYLDNTPFRPEEVGRLFRQLQKEHGRCISKMYIDTPEEPAVPVGWVFVSRKPYDDCNNTYLEEVWVQLHLICKRPSFRIDRKEAM